MASIKKNKVLLVNDAPTSTVVIAQMLKGLGFTVTTAEDGRKAVDCLDQDNFDLVITDLNMPVMDGYELTKIIRRRDDSRFLPVIFVTAGEEAETMERAREVGSTAFLTFPFKKEKLNRIIRSLIR